MAAVSPESGSGHGFLSFLSPSSSFSVLAARFFPEWKNRVFGSIRPRFFQETGEGSLDFHHRHTGTDSLAWGTSTVRPCPLKRYRLAIGNFLMIKKKSICCFHSLISSELLLFTILNIKIKGVCSFYELKRGI